MTLDNYKPFVSKKILARGIEYYESGAIIEFSEISSNHYVAIVESFYNDVTYRVEVDVFNNEIRNSFCTCPYGWGNTCKHEVAVYMEIENCKLLDVEKVNNGGDDEQNQIALNLLNQADEVDIIAFVEEYLIKDKKFRDAFIEDFK